MTESTINFNDLITSFLKPIVDSCVKNSVQEILGSSLEEKITSTLDNVVRNQDFTNRIVSLVEDKVRDRDDDDLREAVSTILSYDLDLSDHIDMDSLAERVYDNLDVDSIADQIRDDLDFGDLNEVVSRSIRSLSADDLCDGFKRDAVMQGLKVLSPEDFRELVKMVAAALVG